MAARSWHAASAARSVEFTAERERFEAQRQTFAALQQRYQQWVNQFSSQVLDYVKQAGKQTSTFRTSPAPKRRVSTPIMVAEEIFSSGSASIKLPGNLFDGADMELTAAQHQRC